MKNINSNCKGMSLPIVMVTLSVMGILAMQMPQFFLHSQKESERINLRLTMSALKSNLKTLMLDDGAWSKTLMDTNNTSLNCLRTGTSCSALSGSFQPVLIVKDGANDAQADSRGGGGFTKAGDLCDTFEDVSDGPGDSRCPIRAEIFWKPICTNAGCINPDVELQVRFTFNSPGVSINTAKYDLSVRRDP